MNLRCPRVVASLYLFSFACSAGGSSAVAASDQALARDAGTSESHSPNHVISPENVATSEAISPAASVCASGDQVVFSCPLAEGSKIASMCAAQSKPSAAPTFYYVFGHRGATELRFPASGHADNAAFNRTHLSFVGNTGGYAYSFANAGYKYIVYLVSGEGASREGGVIVQPSSHSKKATKLTCRSTAITETSDDALIEATLRLKNDPQIESGGLPDTK